MKQKAFLFLNESIGTQQINTHTKAKQYSTHMKLKLAIPMSGFWSLQCSRPCCKETEKPYLFYYIHFSLVLNQFSLLHTCSFPWWLPHGPCSSNTAEVSLVVASWSRHLQYSGISTETEVSFSQIYAIAS